MLGPAVTSALATPQLPAVTAGELLERVSKARPQPLSGTVRSSADLGLPPLPSDGASGPLGMLTGDTEARVWHGGPGKLRVAVDDRLGERQLVVDGRTVTTYDSRANEAIRTTLDPPARRDKGDREHHGRWSGKGHRDAPPVQEAAERALAAVDPTTEVTVGRSARVAGRDAYELRVSPRTDDSLIETVSLAVDAETSMPLRVRVEARDARDEPAYEVGWTKLRLERPDDDRFDYRPPASAKLTERTVAPPKPGEHPGVASPAAPAAATSAAPDAPADAAPESKEEAVEAAMSQLAARAGATAPPEVRGSGWTSVAVLRGVSLPEVLLQAAQAGPDETRLLRTRLLTVLIEKDGTVYVGAVKPDVLRAAARS